MSEHERTGLHRIVGVALLIGLVALLVPQARALAPEDVQLKHDAQSVAQVTAMLLERLPGARHHLENAMRAAHPERGQVGVAPLLGIYGKASGSISGAPSWTRVPMAQLEEAVHLADQRGLVLRVPTPATLEAILRGARPRYLLLDPIWHGEGEPLSKWQGYDLYTGRRVHLHPEAALAGPSLILGVEETTVGRHPVESDSATQRANHHRAVAEGQHPQGGR